jgi:uncharacterized protein YifN (PemK superfamily)
MNQRQTFYPKKRMILMCDFDQLGFIPPEMTKTRRVVVLRAFERTALVVPLSATEPRTIRPYHAVIDSGDYASLTVRVWAKCDALTHVSLGRLQPVIVRGRSFAERLSEQDFRRVLESVTHATGLTALTAVQD